MPGARDTVRFPAGAAGESVVDPAFGGRIGSLVVKPGFRGQVILERDLAVRNGLRLGDGVLAQGNHRFALRAYVQTGGTFQGGGADLTIAGRARVSGGRMVTPSAGMIAQSLTIDRPGVVQMGASGKLTLTGSGTPLNGTGRLDTSAFRPNSVEYTGSNVTDLALALPAVAAALAAPVPHGFSRAGTLGLSASEDSLTSAVIDPAAGFAYVGTATIPAIVVNVSLSTFTRVGALTFNPGENDLTSAVIDPGAGFAYFGTNTSPGRVVKVNLTSFTRVGALALSPGENVLDSAVIDPAAGFAYFGTYTNPGIVVKVGLATFARAGALTLNPGENQLTSAVIDPEAHVAYFGTKTSPGGIVIKVNLSSFTRAGALTLNQDLPFAAAISPADGLAFFGTYTNPGRVVRFRLHCPGPRLIATQTDVDRTGDPTVHEIGDRLRFTATLTNTGTLDQPDNAGGEFADPLPASLRLDPGACTATGGTVTCTDNTVAWNGAIAPGSGVAITYDATVNDTVDGTPVADGTVICNQGAAAFDADNSGDNETVVMTDDPTAPAAADPTCLAVSAMVAVEATKSYADLSGDPEVHVQDDVIRYTVVLHDSGPNDQHDNPGDEFVDTLPPTLSLQLGSCTARTGTVSCAGNSISWNGAIPSGGSSTITYEARLASNLATGTLVCNQGTASFDANHDGRNDSAEPTNDPSSTSDGDPTCFVATFVEHPPESAIILVSFAASVSPSGQVQLTWETASELKNAGFHLYRASTAEGPYTRITERLIPGQGNVRQGARYQWVDQPGRGRYSYTLVDIDTAGYTTSHGPINVWVAAARLYLPLARRDGS
jgi:uncharacterized repeat protein (TIGR01451 family)